MNSVTFTLLFKKLAFLVKLVTHAEFTCEFIAFWRKILVWNVIWIFHSSLATVWLIEIFAEVTVLGSPALITTALREVTLIVVGVIIELRLVIARPSETRVWAHGIHTWITHSSALARLICVGKVTSALSELVTFVSKFANWGSSWLHWDDYDWKSKSKFYYSHLFKIFYFNEA